MVVWRGWLARLVAVCLTYGAGALPSVVISRPASAFQQALGERTVPSEAYDVAQATLATGDFRGALQIAGREYQGSIQVGGQRWIDSIAAAAIVGECQYELGDLRAAVAAYDDALLLATTHADWLVSVQFPSQRLRPMPQPRVATWGRSSRGTAPALIPGTVSIRQGGTDPAQVLKKGGVLAAPVNFPIRPQEIMRALVIAIYRHGCILGTLANEAGPLTELQRALAKRPAPPNHYSQSWIDIALGMALWSQGRVDEAFARFKSGLLVENQFDHLLTSWALIGMGRIALDAGRDAEAAQLFEEATYSAADHGDARALEEAFHWAFTAHVVAGSRGVPPSIAGGVEWSQRALPVLHARLLAMQAECLAIAGDPQGAGRLLAAVDGRLLRGDPGRGLCGAEVAAASAAVAYRTAAIDLGDRELGRAITIMQAREPRRFQVERLVESIRAGSSAVSDRRANELFLGLLGDPPPRSFSLDPVGTLASITAPRQEAFETWIAVAGRRGLEDGLAAAEAAVRSRWLESQPLGGRRVAIETLIGAAPDALSAEAADRRAAILARTPQLAAAVDSMTRIGATLRAEIRAVAAAGNPPEPKAWQEYQRLATVRADLVAGLAAGREPTSFDFPPLVPPTGIRGRLRPGEVILSFHWTSTGLTGVLESKDGRAAWDIKQPGTLSKEIAGLARALCLFESAAAVPTERLATTDWRLHAERVERMLFKDSRINLGDPAIRELVIVPDGLLWYLPFEILPVGSGREGAAAEEPRMLRDVCPIRYCPTRSLAVDRFAAAGGPGLVGVHMGRMHRGDTPEASRHLVERLSASLDSPLFLATPSEPPMALTASLLDTLIVFEELTGDGTVADRPLVVAGQRQPGITFGQWVASPRKQPRQVVLPGFKSAMDGGLVKLPPRPGNDLFLAVMDLIAAGGRTALVSRWRMGGLSTVHLVEEFVRDLDRSPVGEALRPSAAESWQRAVDVASAEQPDLPREPRLAQSPDAVLADSRHPLFWAGYLLVDCGSGDRPEPVRQQPAPPRVTPPKPAAPPARQATP